jgi:hypothetical protein
MQANKQQNILNSVHAVVQANVSKMYSRIDAVIESAKEFVTSNPENGQKIVDHVTSYTKYMHKVIEQIIQSYSTLLDSAVFGKNNPMKKILESNQWNDSSDDESTADEDSSDEISKLLQKFKAEFAQNIDRAKNATNKIQTLLTPLVQ